MSSLLLLFIIFIIIILLCLLALLVLGIPSCSHLNTAFPDGFYCHRRVRVVSDNIHRMKLFNTFVIVAVFLSLGAARGGKTKCSVCKEVAASIYKYAENKPQ